ncbi:MAG: hypothetical protein ACRC0G_15510 [Fusobacteriaceae bacterium]
MKEIIVKYSLHILICLLALSVVELFRYCKKINSKEFDMEKVNDEIEIRRRCATYIMIGLSYVNENHLYTIFTFVVELILQNQRLKLEKRYSKSNQRLLDLVLETNRKCKNQLNSSKKL